MNKAVLLAALGGVALLASKRAGAAAPVPSPTSKPIAQRVAEVLATNDPDAIRFEAGRLKAEGYAGPAADLEKAARVLEAEIAAGRKAPPKRGAAVVTARSPGIPQPAAAPPPIVVPVAPEVAIATVPKAGVPASYPRRGAKGEPVRIVQLRLAALGYDVGTADGVFGPQTDKALRSFQRESGLEPDGIVGPKTAAALLKGGA